MRPLDLKNPFGAPVYHAETVSSTFDVSRGLAGEGKRHGTVITADFQEAGRGRAMRPWTAEQGKNLLFTILLHYGDSSSIPPALTLRTGLAVSLAIEDLVPPLAGSVTVKWPNDIMIGVRKTAGILTEWDGRTVYIGVGVNVFQRDFPGEYRAKAGSIIQSYPDLGDANFIGDTNKVGENVRFDLLEMILSRLYDEIEEPRSDASREDWRKRLDKRLYKRGETVAFAPGTADSECLVEGILSGIGPEGELLIIPEGEEKELAFMSGELRVY